MPYARWLKQKHFYFYRSWKKATFIYQMMTQTLRTSIPRKLYLHVVSLYASIGVVTCVQMYFKCNCNRHLTLSIELFTAQFFLWNGQYIYNMTIEVNEKVIIKTFLIKFISGKGLIKEIIRNISAPLCTM